VGIGRGEALQRRIVEAIEALRPVPGAPPRAAAPARLRYRLLSLRYVETRDVRDVCAELAISQRKYYVEHVLGVKAVISWLTAPRPPRESVPGAPPAGRPAAGGRWPDPPRQETSAANPFVGRLNELARLTALYETLAAQPRGRLVMISGEAGVGKSRLARTFAGYAAARGATVLEGRY